MATSWVAGALIVLTGGCGSSDRAGPVLPKATQAKLPTNAHTLVDRLCVGSRTDFDRRVADATKRELGELTRQLEHAPTARVTVAFAYTDKVDAVPRLMSVRKLAEMEADSGPGSSIPSKARCYEHYRKVLRGAVSNSR